MPRKTIIAGNWKMNLLPQAAKKLVDGIADGYTIKENLEVVICPSTALLSKAANWLKGTGIQLGAQNCSDQISGAYTGETSPQLLKALGCNYCIVGHSERREYYSESDDFVAAKTQLLESMGITPIVCVGETLEEREKGIHKEKIENQVKAIYSKLDKTAYGKLVFAYEPIWAIGTGKTATPQQADEIHELIRKVIAKVADENLAHSTCILYGGSVKGENAKELLAQKNIDGALVGGASLKIDDFLKIINAF